MTTTSRIFGLVRDIVIANIFAASAGSDAFFVAFKIPNYLRRLFAEGGFSQAFLPVLAEYKIAGDPRRVQELIDYVSGLLSLILVGVTIFGVVAAPLWIRIFAAGFADDADQLQMSIYMLRISFPYIFFISLTAFAGAILNTYGRFAIPALTPVLLNISLILSAIFLAPYLQQPVTALAWGVFIAGIVQLSFQLPFLIRINKLPRPRLNIAHAGIKKIMRLMIPTLFATSIAQINLIVDMFMASFLVTGSISWLYYSDRLTEFPLGVFGIALATVILPQLSEQYVQKNAKHFSRIIDWSLRWVLLISLPATIGLMLLAKPILFTIFQHGQFNAFHVQMVAQSLIAYAFGLPSFIAMKVLSSSYFSRQDTKTPVKIGFIAMLANIILNLLLIGWLAHAGLALATSLSALINASLLFYFLRTREIYKSEQGWSILILRVITASLVMAILIYFMVPETAVWNEWGTLQRVAKLSLYISTSMISYFVTLWIIGLRPQAMMLRVEGG